MNPLPDIAAVTMSEQLQIWKLDSKAESLIRLNMFPDQKQNDYAHPENIWHPTEPTVAWINDKTIHWYNVQEDRLTTFFIWQDK